MKIQDIFQLEVKRRIPAVAKVDDIDPITIEQELREYVITTPIERALADFLETYAESRVKPVDEIGVWISGFFGSGKSHFAKILSYLLRNQSIGGQRAIELFKGRLDATRDAAAPIAQHLHRLQQIDSHVVMFNIEAMKRTTSIAETMYSQYLAQERGLSATLTVGRLELSLLRRGLYDRFKQVIDRELGEPWTTVREDFTMVRSAVKTALAKLDKKLYGDEQAVDKALIDLEKQGAFSIADRAQDLAAYVDELRAGGDPERPPHLVFVVDEIGQFVGREKGRLLELQTVAEEFATRGRGKLWLLVTSQQELKSIVSDIGSVQDEFGRIITRFDTRLTLTSEDVERVLEDRILKKNAAGQSTLDRLFDRSGGTLSAIGKLPGATRDLPPLVKESFASHYPFLPYQFTLLQDIFKAARTGVTTGFTLNTEARSMLGVCQGVIVKTLLEAEVGRMVPLDAIFDQVSIDLNQADASEINKVAGQLPGATAFDTRLVKVLYFIQQVSYVVATADVLAHLLIRDVQNETIASERDQVTTHLSQLMAAGFVVEKEAGVYEFLTGAKKTFEEEVASVKTTKNDLRRVVRLRLAEVLREVGQVDYEKKQRFKVTVYGDGDATNNGDNALVLQVYSPLHLKLEDALSVEAIEVNSFAHPETVYWLGKVDDDLDRQATRAHKLKEVLSNRQSKSGKAEDDRALLREKGTELETLQRTLETRLRSALFNGTLIWNGSVEELDGRTTTLNPTFNRALSQVVPHVYPKFDRAAVKPDGDAIKTVLTASDYTLNTIQPGLELFDAKNHLNTHSPAIEEVLRELELRDNKGQDRDGRSLIANFEAPPYGWHPEVIRLIFAAIFRGGMLTIKSDNVVYDDASMPAAQDKLTKANEFKSATFIYEADEAVSLTERQQVQAALTVMFNRAHTQDTASALADYVLADLKSLTDRVERLALQLRQAEYPLPASFKPARETIQRVVTHTRPNKIVRVFLENVAALRQLNGEADLLYQFVEHDRRLPVYRQACQLFKTYLEAQQVYAATALHNPTVAAQAAVLDEGRKQGAAGERWAAFDRAYTALLATFRAAYEAQHTSRDELYARLNAELASDGAQIDHFRTYACGDLKFDAATTACTTCGHSFNMLAEQMLGMPEAARMLREARKRELTASSAPQRVVKQISVSTLLAGREVDQTNLDEALQIIRKRVVAELDKADAVELI